jgi:hypothetical protein
MGVIRHKNEHIEKDIQMIIDFLQALGSPTIKSIEMLVHICVGINSGVNSPSVFMVSPLF